jgi:hypothetical protein
MKHKVDFVKNPPNVGGLTFETALENLLNMRTS